MLEVEGDFKVGSIQSERENDTDIPFQERVTINLNMCLHILSQTWRVVLSTWCTHCTCGEKDMQRKRVCFLCTCSRAFQLCVRLHNAQHTCRQRLASINLTSALLSTCMMSLTARHTLGIIQQEQTQAESQGAKTAWSMCSQRGACSPSGQGILLSRGLAASLNGPCVSCVGLQGETVI